MKIVPYILLTATCTFVATVNHAHVVFAEPTVAPNSSFRGVLKVGHGCEGSPTIALRVLIPEGFVSVKPMPKAGWKLETKMTKLAKPFDSHGKTISEAVSEITWSGTLDDTHYDEFVFVARAPEATGKHYFKVQQRCEKGEWNWVEVPEAGKSRKDYKAPAAELTVTHAGSTLPAKAKDEHKH